MADDVRRDQFGVSRSMDKRLLARNPLTKVSDIAAMITFRFFDKLSRVKAPVDPAMVRMLYLESANDVVAMVEDAWERMHGDADLGEFPPLPRDDAENDGGHSAS